MKSVAIVTDSTSDLPPDLAGKLDIHVIACNVHFGTEVFREHIELDRDTFYEKLRASPQLPTTSQPSVGAFLEFYRPLVDRYSAIVSIHIAGKLSGTLQTAVLALREITGVPVAPVDSESVSMGLGWLAVIAARAAQDGATLDEIVRRVERARERVRLLAVLANLENALKGGRVNKAEAFIGTMLSIKPILLIEKSAVEPLEKVRTWSRALVRLEDMVKEWAPLEELAILHARAPQDANALADRLGRSFPRDRMVVTEVGAVLGTHAGPGAIGVAMLRQAPAGSG